MHILDGKALAKKEQMLLKQVVDGLKIKPSLHVILVGNLVPSQIYVDKKQKAAAFVGIDSVIHALEDSITTEALCACVQSLNHDPSVHGILLQLPLPKHIDSRIVIETISPLKDVDGLTSKNLGKLMLGLPDIVPCTPKGCLDLIKLVYPKLEGLHAVIIGRSSLVGKPLSQLLILEDATVTLAHSKTKNLKEITQKADILVAAIGSPQFFSREFIKEGAVVIDVGISRSDDGQVIGDVDFESVKDHVLAISPVPGGVGPMTVTNLLKNTLKCYDFSSQ
ncbi:MAG: Bifunctional protein FolD protein [Holosporales bacterium]